MVVDIVNSSFTASSPLNFLKWHVLMIVLSIVRGFFLLFHLTPNYFETHLSYTCLCS